MKTKPLIRACTFLAFAWILISCARTPTSTQEVVPSPASTADIASPECISPVTNLAVTVGWDAPVPTPQPIAPINWKMIAELPEAAGAGISSFAAQKNAIWVSYNAQATGDKKLLKYNLDKNTWSSYNPTGDYYVGASRFLITKDGTTWSYYLSGVKNASPNFRLLSRYDPSLDQFEFVLDKQGLLQYPTELRSNIVEDTNGLFWFFVKDATDEKLILLYSFNPLTLQVEKHPLQINAYTTAITFGPDGKIWTVEFPSGTLWQYDPVKKETRSFNKLGKTDVKDRPDIKLNDILNGISFLYFDRAGRLWLGNKGWLDVSNPDHIVFYALIPSPVFLAYYSGDMYGDAYGLDTSASNVYQSTNGSIWFTIAGGVVRLNIEDGYKKGEWCLITNGSSKVVEDSEHNLWMSVFNKIYKYQR